MSRIRLSEVKKLEEYNTYVVLYPSGVYDFAIYRDEVFHALDAEYTLAVGDSEQVYEILTTPTLPEAPGSVIAIHTLPDEVFIKSKDGESWVSAKRTFKHSDIEWHEYSFTILRSTGDVLDRDPKF